MKKIYTNYGKIEGTLLLLRLLWDLMVELLHVYNHFRPYVYSRSALTLCMHLLKTVFVADYGRKMQEALSLEMRRHTDPLTVAVFTDIHALGGVFLRGRRASYLVGNVWLMRYCYMLMQEEPFHEAVDALVNRGILRERLRILGWLEYLLGRVRNAKEDSTRVAWIWVMFDEFIYYCESDTSQEAADLADAYNEEVALHPGVCLRIEKIT